MTDEEIDSVLSKTFGSVMGNCAALVAAGAHPLQIAACLAQIAMSIYKEVLPPEEYEQMCDKISDSRGIIREFSSIINNTNDRVLH
ncbi:MAG: hypothetical protein CMK29_01290 [Porticoccaceae bacterium]|nr:hypothetical protein [Porticoccaceae bacterium]|tara:strand:- start:40 stop:297 length:258 start_codon:yes stop_codon:yes gene_type:complete